MNKVTWVDISILIMTVILAVFLGYMMFGNLQFQNLHEDSANRSLSTEACPEVSVVFEPVFEPVETEVETELEPEAESVLLSEETIAVVENTTEIGTAQEDPYFALNGYRYRSNVPLPDELQRYIHDKCQEYNVPEYLLYGLMENESHFRYDLISTTNDYGICQINTCNHASLSAELGISDFLDPYQCSLAGIKMLSNALTIAAGNERCALMVYHYPSTALDDWKNGIYTNSYAETVIASAEKYR